MLYLSYIPFWLTKGTRWAQERRWSGAGFIGTLVGWALLYAMPEGRIATAAVLAAATAAGSAVCGRAQTALGHHDDARIILDETIGFWFAAALLPRDPVLLAAAFIIFRVLDACKPPPIRSCERLPGGFGVVMDDVAAGAATNLILRGVGMLAPGWWLI
ncbi:MAG: phosphatidylglycerophosphatase A [Elusimicrobiota bacterium]